MSNAQIATLAVGLISITEGGDVLVGRSSPSSRASCIGTLFMAFHSAQGPQLGLPQMIQSRPQFGYVGALLVWLFAYVQYAGFNVFNSILAGDVDAPHRARPDQDVGRRGHASSRSSSRSSATTSSTRPSGA